jgi:hypothetical protein
MLKIYYTYWNGRNIKCGIKAVGLLPQTSYIGIGGEKDGICSRDHMCPGK